MNRRSRLRRGAALPLTLLGASLVLGGTACDTNTLLNVTDPAVATPESLAQPSAVPTLYAGVIGDFQVAYAGYSDGNNEGYLTVSALLSDEMLDADTYQTRNATDQRAQQPVANGNTSDAAFSMLQRARHSAQVAADAIAGAVSKTDTRIAVMKSLEGFTYLALGEGYCSGGVAFSDVVDGAQVYRAPLSQAQVWDSSAARFQAALAVDGGASDTAYLARVGLGRALLNAGKFPEAAAAVANVPTEFAWFVEHSDNSQRQFNAFYYLQANARYTVSDLEGGNGLPFRSAKDPRVLSALGGNGKGFDKITPLYLDLRYSTYGSPVVLASGVEARLIEAEAALQAGNTTTWLARLNDLRVNVGPLMAGLVGDYAAQLARSGSAATLAPLTDPGTPAARTQLMFSERGFWLYTTGHRLGDLRRLMRAPYGLSDTQAFPTGGYTRTPGTNYGHDVAFPLPFRENQNPNLVTLATTCDVTKP